MLGVASVITYYKYFLWVQYIFTYICHAKIAPIQTYDVFTIII